MDERNTGSFHLTGAGQSGGVSGSEVRWIPVTERLPADGVLVLTYPAWGGGGVDTDFYMASMRNWCHGVEDGYSPTHWMPLPMPPTERSAEPTRAGTERHTRNEPDPESGIRISPGSSIPVERGMV